MYPYATTIQELAKYLRNLKNVHYRFMAEQIDNEFKVTRLIIGPKAPWEEYRYKDVFFIAGTEYGENVANWLLTGTITNYYQETFSIIPMNDHIYSSRHPTHSQAGLFTPSVPFTMYTISFSQPVNNQEHTFASENAPFFLTRWEAERHLLYEVPEDSTSSTQIPDQAVYVYIEHPEAWLEKIHFSLTALEIYLAGPSLY